MPNFMKLSEKDALAAISNMSLNNVRAELKKVHDLEEAIEKRIKAGLKPAKDVKGKAVTAARAQRCVDELAQKIFFHPTAKNPILIPVMDGGLVFGAKIVEALKGLMEKHPDRDFSFQYKTKTSTTYKGTKSVVTDIGAPKKEEGPLEKVLEGERDVFLLDDVDDTGRTMKKLKDESISKGARAVYSVVWFNKKPPEGVKKPDPDFYGLKLPRDFLLGLGMDYHGLGRNLPELMIVDVATICTPKEEAYITKIKQALNQQLRLLIKQEASQAVTPRLDGIFGRRATRSKTKRKAEEPEHTSAQQASM